MDVVRLVDVCGEEPCVTTQRTVVKQITLNNVVHDFSSFRLNRFSFFPLFS